jgi:hypothetical protein
MTLHFHINLITHKLSARSWWERGDKIRKLNMDTKQCAPTDMTCQQEQLMKSKYNERISAKNIFVKLPTQEIEISFHICRNL